MKITTNDLKRLFRSYIRDKTPVSVENCPSPDIISHLFFQPSAQKPKREIIDHICNCSRCLEVFELCLEMSRGEKWLVSEIRTHLRPEKKRRSVMFNLPKRLAARSNWINALIPVTAAILLIIAIIAIRYFTTDKNEEERGRPPGAIYLLNPISDFSVDATVIFKWTYSREIKFVVLDIFDEALLPVWKSNQIFGNSYDLPQEALKTIKKGKTYFWMVTIFLPDGTEIESALKQFSISE
jgi:hypothetical protein